jgi:hypothetical protein
MEDNSTYETQEMDNPDEPSVEEQGQETEETPEWEGHFSSPDAMWKSYSDMRSMRDRTETENQELKSTMKELVEALGGNKQSSSYETKYDSNTSSGLRIVDEAFGLSDKLSKVEKASGEMEALKDQINFLNFKASHPDLDSRVLGSIRKNFSGGDYESAYKEIIEPLLDKTAGEASRIVARKTKAKGNPAKSGSLGSVDEIAKSIRSMSPAEVVKRVKDGEYDDYLKGERQYQE